MDAKNDRFIEEIENLKHENQRLRNKLESNIQELNALQNIVDLRAGDLLIFKRDLNDFLKAKGFWRA